MTVEKALIQEICLQNPTWDFLILFVVSPVLMRIMIWKCIFISEYKFRNKQDGHNQLFTGTLVLGLQRGIITQPGD